MKKVAGIVAVVVFTVGLFATQIEKTIEFGFDIENILACANCSGDIDPRRPKSKTA